MCGSLVAVWCRSYVVTDCGYYGTAGELSVAHSLCSFSSLLLYHHQFYFPLSITHPTGNPIVPSMMATRTEDGGDFVFMR